MPDYELLNLVRLILVLALVVAAAALATPKDRIPLALRGIVRLLVRDTPHSASDASPRLPSRPSPLKRLLAFVLVLLALALALIMV